MLKRWIWTRLDSKAPFRGMIDFFGARVSERCERYRNSGGAREMGRVDEERGEIGEEGGENDILG